jgi:hypothetical protein
VCRDDDDDDNDDWDKGAALAQLQAAVKTPSREISREAMTEMVGPATSGNNVNTRGSTGTLHSMMRGGDLWCIELTLVRVMMVKKAEARERRTAEAARQAACTR